MQRSLRESTCAVDTAFIVNKISKAYRHLWLLLRFLSLLRKVLLCILSRITILNRKTTGNSLDLRINSVFQPP